MTQLRHRLHQELALHVLDPFVQPRLVVPGEDGDLALGQHRTGVHPGVDHVHGRTRHGRAGGQGVPDGVRSGEGRQQGGVGVDQPAAERVEDGWADDLHEAGGDDQVGLDGGEFGGQGAVPGGAVGVVGDGADERRQAAASGVLEALGVAVAADGDHGRRVVRIVGRGQQGGAQRPGPGEQDGDPGPRGRAALVPGPRPPFRP